MIISKINHLNTYITAFVHAQLGTYIIDCSAIKLFMYLCIVYMIMKATGQTTCNDNCNNNSVVFLILFVIAAVIIILLTIIIIYLVIRVRKFSYSPNNA